MEVKDLYQTARALGVCSRFTGRETTPELCALLATPQGLEFCIKHRWPTLAVFRQFRGAQTDGVYIDARVVKLHNAKSVILVGDTQAELTYDDPTPDLHQVAVLYGASARIKASKWSVVDTRNWQGSLHKYEHDFAVIR